MIEREYRFDAGRTACLLLVIAAWCCGCAAGPADSGPRPSSTVKDFLRQDRVVP